MAVIHVQRILSSSLEQLNRGPDFLTSQIDSVIEVNADPRAHRGGVDGLFSKQFTGLVVDSLAIETEGIVTISGDSVRGCHILD